MEEFLSASHDVMFKALFVRNKDLLCAFLNDILDLSIANSDEIEILNPELIPAMANGKLSRLDLHVETANRKFNIEMQARRDGFSPERVLYYWAELFSARFESGTEYEKLEQTYSVNILGFRFLDCETYHSSYSILEEKRQEAFTDKLAIHIFELPKVPKEWIAADNKQLWMKLIKANSKEALEMIKTTTSSPAIQKGVAEVCKLNADAALQEQIRQRDKAIRDYENDIAVAVRKGRAEGEAKGRAEGEAKGRAEGEAKGRAETNAMYTTKLKMLGWTEEQIQQFLNL